VYNKNSGSSVGITTGYGMDDRRLGVRVPVEQTVFTSPYLPDLLWGDLSPGVKLEWVKLTSHL
jgi:hypothetical protein